MTLRNSSQRVNARVAKTQSDSILMANRPAEPPRAQIATRSALIGADRQARYRLCRGATKSCVDPPTTMSPERQGRPRLQPTKARLDVPPAEHPDLKRKRPPMTGAERQALYRQRKLAKASVSIKTPTAPSRTVRRVDGVNTGQGDGVVTISRDISSITFSGPPSNQGTQSGCAPGSASALAASGDRAQELACGVMTRARLAKN